MHELHEAIHLAAALVLLNGGVVILILAAIQRRRLLAAATDDHASTTGHAAGLGGREGSASHPLRSEVWVAVALSAFAAAIHLAAGPAHVVELGDLGLLFYATAMFQAGWAVAFARRPDRPAIAWVGILGNLAISGAWLLSRTVGLPAGPDPWTPEAIGIPDGVATGFQLALAAILLIQLRVRVARSAGPTADSTEAMRRLCGWSAAVGVPLIGIVFLAGLLGTSLAAAGHDDHGSPDHASTVTTDHAHTP